MALRLRRRRGRHGPGPRPVPAGRQVPGEHRHDDRHIGGWEMPASWLQSVNAIFIILLAPVFSWLWLWLKERQPSAPLKFAFGLIFLGLGFGVMVLAALRTNGGERQVLPTW